MQFLFPSILAERVTPIQDTDGTFVAMVNLNQGKYIHSATHQKGAYDEIVLDSLASGTAAAGAYLRADGAGGAQFSIVSPSSSSSSCLNISLCSKRVRYTVPTKIVNFAFSFPNDRNNFAAQVTIKENTSYNTWKWRLYNAGSKTVLVEGDGNELKSFIYSAFTQGEKIEFHAWVDAGNYITVEGITINSF